VGVTRTLKTLKRGVNGKPGGSRKRLGGSSAAGFPVDASAKREKISESFSKGGPKETTKPGKSIRLEKKSKESEEVAGQRGRGGVL